MWCLIVSIPDLFPLSYFHADLISVCLDPCLSWVGDLHRGAGLGPRWDVLQTLPGQCFFCCSLMFSVLCLLCLYARLFICALKSPAGKGLTSWLSFVEYNCKFVNFSLVSLVRCGT